MGKSQALCQIVLRLAFVLVCSAVCCLGQQTHRNDRLLIQGGTTAFDEAPNRVKPGQPASSSETNRHHDESYRIGAEDNLLISVWQEPDLSLPVVVRPDGMITLPLINDVSAVGLTPKELQMLLVERLQGFLNDPHVTVLVESIQSRRFYLLGEVTRPGVFPLPEHQTILGALLEAGGLTPFAKSESIYVLRQTGAKAQRIPFKFKKALKGDNGGQDVELLPGDTIVVP